MSVRINTFFQRIIRALLGSSGQCACAERQEPIRWLSLR